MDENGFYRFKAENAKGTATYSSLLEHLTPGEVKAQLAYRRRVFPDWKHSAERVEVRPTYAGVGSSQDG